MNKKQVVQEKIKFFEHDKDYYNGWKKQEEINKIDNELLEKQYNEEIEIFRMKME